MSAPYKSECPSGDGQNAEQSTDDVEFTAEKKRFATLQAKFALQGHDLHKSGPADGPGPVSYLAERWGLVRHLPTLTDVDRFLIEIGGRP